MAKLRVEGSLGYTQDDGKGFYEYISYDVSGNNYVWNATFDSENNLIERTK
jgi:hypothetical protein